MNGARALGRLEGAIEDGQMVVFDVRRAFDGAGGVYVGDDRVGLLVRVAELEQGAGHRVVHDLDHASATSFLYLIRARSGSMPVVSQSIKKPIVPVGARTVTWLLR